MIGNGEAGAATPMLDETTLPLAARLIEQLAVPPETGPAGRKGEMTRNAILRSALAVFSRRGFDGASTHEIAAAAGLTQSLLTYHFPTKLRLWQDVVNVAALHFRTALGEELARVPDEGSALLLLRMALRSYLRWASRNPAIVRILMDANGSGGGATQWYVERHIAPLYHVLTHLIRSAQQDGDVVAGDPAHLYYLVISSAMVFAIASEVEVLTGADACSDRYVEGHAEALLTLLERRSR